MKKIHKLALLLLVAIAGCTDAVEEKSEPTNASFRTEADIDKLKLTDLENKAIDMKQHKGKTVFVNFWATWCNPCIAEMPSIQRLQTRCADENIIFLLVSDDDVNQIEDFKNANDYTFNYARMERIASMNIQAIPTTFIYAPNGSLVFSETGSRNWADSASIQMILKIVSKQ